MDRSPMSSTDKNRLAYLSILFFLLRLWETRPNFSKNVINFFPPLPVLCEKAKYKEIKSGRL
jgi:hypothetical protein